MAALSDPTIYLDIWLQDLDYELSLGKQEAGLKVREYELLRGNFSDSGNFGATYSLLSILSALYPA